MAKKKPSHVAVMDTIQKHFKDREFRPAEVQKLTKGLTPNSANVYLSIAARGKSSKSMLDVGYGRIYRIREGVYVYNEHEPAEATEATEATVLEVAAPEVSFTSVVDDVSTRTVLAFDEISGVLLSEPDESPAVVEARRKVARGLLELAGQRLLDVARR